MGITQDFADSPIINRMGVVTGTSSVLQFPDRPCLMARFKTNPSNAGAMGLGSSVAGAPFYMAAGDDTGWVAAKNLNQFFYVGNGYTVAYWLQE